MSERTCQKCGHLCHCIEADHQGCKCDGCKCSTPEDDASYENNGGLVIDSTDDCEWCQ